MKKKGEPAYKPGSVMDNHSSRACVTTCFKRPTRIQRGPRHKIPIWSCSEWGLPCREVLPLARCALTAPFHPYLTIHRIVWRFIFCCTFRRLTPPRGYLALCPLEPGLSSPPSDKNLTRRRLSSRLAAPGYRERQISASINLFLPEMSLDTLQFNAVVD